MQKTEVRILPVPYTPEEIDEMEAKVTEFTHTIIPDLDDKRADAASDVKKAKDERRRLANAVKVGEHDEDVVCNWSLDAGSQTMNLVRSDTGEVVETRPATASELNTDMFESDAEMTVAK